mgnify:CR=1 FL=1|tara:strand:+ start:1319 stop:1492 length:174 start_codon:yes stop_codon:yes gene_type:complete
MEGGSLILAVIFISFIYVLSRAANYATMINERNKLLRKEKERKQKLDSLYGRGNEEG